MNKLSRQDILTIGFALFAMFFGAGNLIFPPQLGVLGGDKWWIGFLFYFLADLGLGIAAFFAMAKLNGKTELVADPLGRVPSIAMLTAIIVCIGPGLAIPRTAATTYEMGVVPLLGLESSTGSLAIMSVVFFALVLAFTIRPSKVLDIVGKFLTPLLMIALAILIIKGFITGGDIPAPAVEYVAREGIANGYQTLDMMASIFFAVLIINTAKEKGYSSQKSITSISIYAAFVATALLFVVYGGLSYLGATAGNVWRDGLMSGEISPATLLSLITERILGSYGTMVLALVVSTACLTTAVGLVSASAEYFEELLGGKLSYKKLVVIMCVVSACICNLGLVQIISISAPILTLLYPVTILMIITVFVRDRITSVMPYRITAVVTMIFSIIDVAGRSFGVQACADFTAKLPLSSYGFGWFPPSIALFAILAFVAKGRNNEIKE